MVTKRPVKMEKIIGPNMFLITFSDGSTQKSKLHGPQVKRVHEKIKSVLDKSFLYDTIDSNPAEGGWTDVQTSGSTEVPDEPDASNPIVDTAEAATPIAPEPEPAEWKNIKPIPKPPKRGAKSWLYADGDDTAVRLRPHLRNDFAIAWKHKDVVEQFYNKGWEVAQYNEIIDGDRIANFAGKNLDAQVTRQDMVLMMLHKDGVAAREKLAREKYRDPLSNEFQRQQMESTVGKTDSVYFPDGGIKVT